MTRIVDDSIVICFNLSSFIFETIELDEQLD